MFPVSTPTIIKAKTHVRGFGQFPCSACGRKTTGKLADHVRGVCGTYFTNCIPLCSRCYHRVAKAAAKAVKGGAR